MHRAHLCVSTATQRPFKKVCEPENVWDSNLNQKHAFAQVPRGRGALCHRQGPQLNPSFLDSSTSTGRRAIKLRHLVQSERCLRRKPGLQRAPRQLLPRTRDQYCRVELSRLLAVLWCANSGGNKEGCCDYCTVGPKEVPRKQGYRSRNVNGRRLRLPSGAPGAVRLSISRPNFWRPTLGST